MTNPESRTRQARRIDLISATIRLVYRDGVQSASLARIAAEAGTSKGTALYHFATKEDLLGAVVTSLFEAGGSYMSERITAAPDTPRAKVSAYLESNFRFIVEHVEHVVATQRIVQLAGVVEAGDAITPLRAMLESGQREGSFGRFDPEFMAHTIRDIIDSAAYYLPKHPEMSGDQFVSEGVGLVLRAIGVQADATAGQGCVTEAARRAQQ